MAAVLVASLILLIPGVGVLLNYPTAGVRDAPLDLHLRGDTEATDYAEEVFRQVGPEAVIMADLDRPVFSLWHQRYVVEPRSQVTVIGRNFLQFAWYRESLERHHPGTVPPELPQDFAGLVRAVVKEHLGRRPVYLTFRDPIVEQGHELRAEGRLFRVVREKEGTQPPS